jgi:DMSO/TMAO reductase YedYZ molybdopterin-dependent catalytic subunit
MMFSTHTSFSSLEFEPQGGFFELHPNKASLEDISSSSVATLASPPPKKKQQHFELVQTPEFRQWSACIDASMPHVRIPESPHPESWTIEISATTHKPNQDPSQETLTQTIATLHQLPMAQQLRRVVSKHGWSYKARWVGVPFKTWIEQLPATMKDRVKACKWLEQRSASGASLWVSLKHFMEGEPLLMYAESDQSLTPWHGGPVRLGVFHRYMEMGLPQLTALHFTDTLPETLDATALTPEQELKQWGFAVGKYYAYDLKNFKPVERPREVTAY